MKHSYHSKKQSTIIQQRQKQFNTRHILSDPIKDYQALSDPHTEYYFASPPAIKQLKHYKRTLSTEPNQNLKKSQTKLINFRIRKNKEEKKYSKKGQASEQGCFDFRKITKLSIFSINTFYQRANMKKDIGGRYGNKNKSYFSVTDSYQKHNQSLDSKEMKEKKTFDASSFSEMVHLINPENLSPKYKMSQPNRHADQLREYIHKAKHQKWMQFLKERKQQCLLRVKTEDK